MKIKPEHYASLRQGILTNIDKIAIHRAFLVAEGKAKDVDKRLRWDAFWAIPSIVRTPLVDAIYKYADDTHMDTAARAIMREVFSISSSTITK